MKLIKITLLSVFILRIFGMEEGISKKRPANTEVKKEAKKAKVEFPKVHSDFAILMQGKDAIPKITRDFNYTDLEFYLKKSVNIPVLRDSSIQLEGPGPSCFSGKVFAIADNDSGIVKIYELDEQNNLVFKSKISVTIDKDHDFYITELSLSPDSLFLCIENYHPGQPYAEIWQLFKDKEPELVNKEGELSGNRCKFSLNGNIISTRCCGGVYKNNGSKFEIAEEYQNFLDQQDEEIYEISFSSDGKLAAINYEDNDEMCIKDLKSNKTLFTLDLSEDTYGWKDFVFSPDNKFVVCIETEDQIYIIKIGDYSQQSLRKAYSDKTKVVFSPDSKNLAIIDQKSKKLELWSLVDDQWCFVHETSSSICDAAFQISKEKDKSGYPKYEHLVVIPQEKIETLDIKNLNSVSRFLAQKRLVKPGSELALMQSILLNFLSENIKNNQHNIKHIFSFPAQLNFENHHQQAVKLFPYDEEEQHYALLALIEKPIDEYVQNYSAYKALVAVYRTLPVFIKEALNSIVSIK